MLFDGSNIAGINFSNILTYFNSDRSRIASFLTILLVLPCCYSAIAQNNPDTSIGACGRTALMLAFDKKDIKEVNRLLAAGADPNVPNCAEETILMLASIQSTPELVRSLLKAGANPNASQRSGRTALIWAIAMRRLDTVPVLIEGGADVNQPTLNGTTPLMSAVFAEDAEILDLIIRSGARLNDSNEDGASVLAQAGWTCKEDVVKRLITAGATTNQHDWAKHRPPRFEDFPVSNIFRGVPARVNLKSTPWAREYRTRLREARKQGPSFAGHFIVADWGCGSNCQVYSLIDARNGKVYAAGGADRGAEFKLDSALFILDPPLVGQAYQDDPTTRMSARYYVWNGQRFRLIYSEACRVEDGFEKCGCPKVQELTFGKKGFRQPAQRK